MLKLYSSFRSSASYRVRIALHWKELPFEYLPVHLVQGGGQQNQPEYRKINPMGHVPALDDKGFLVAESMAIVQYLDDIHPQKLMFPKDQKARAVVTQICEIINSGIQPLQNLRVNQTLQKEFGLSEDAVKRWNKFWIENGLMNLEKVLQKTSGRFCVGNEVTAADAFLIPQCFSSRRFGVRVEDYPILARIEQEANSLVAFQKAHPEKQPDFA